VDTVVGNGWTLIPTYVGLQATCSSYAHRITTGKEKAQGVASADDAIAILRSLGLPERRQTFSDSPGKESWWYYAKGICYQLQGDQVLKTFIPRSVRVSEAPSYGQTVMTYDPGSTGALSYLEAAREMAVRGAGDRAATSEETP
jgi:hypothetical protein